jgi:hypothetical protein
MPIELQIIRASEFIRVGAHGRYDLDSSKAMLSNLAGACRKRSIDQALLDLRELVPGPVPMLTPNELAQLVNAFHEMGFTQDQKLAVLYKTDPHHGARLFAFIGALRGWKVRAFSDFEAAIVWLSDEKATTEPMPIAEGMEIPLRASLPPEGK